MEITTGVLEWTSEDVILFRQFLATQTGQRLLPKLLEETPILLAEGDTNAICVRSGEVRGMQKAARTLLVMAYPPKETPTSDPTTDYPRLDDDEKWQDGQKVNQPQS